MLFRKRDAVPDPLRVVNKLEAVEQEIQRVERSVRDEISNNRHEGLNESFGFDGRNAGSSRSAVL
ncbi:MAG TPA: hypothetical protein VJ180_01360 [Pyrinomonadaceae bacterium]|nr:hypothetical protein [Pyrinomonadaceae bacterium]